MKRLCMLLVAVMCLGIAGVSSVVAAPKYVIYVIGDGMSPNHVMGAEMYLAELEGRFLARMRTFLKDELGVKALLSDMSAGMENEAYRPVRAALCDYVDEHWYWDHPSFPVKSWSYPSVAHNQNPVRARVTTAVSFMSASFWSLDAALVLLDAPKQASACRVVTP